MSAGVAFLAAVSIYTPLYVILAWSVPHKSGIGFVSRLRVYYATSDWSFWSEWMQAIFSLGTVVLFVVDGYYWDPRYKSWATRVEVMFTVYFMFNFALELLLSKNRWGYVLSFLGMVDIVTIVPVLITIASEVYQVSPSGFVRLYRVLMLPRVIHLNRLVLVGSNIGHLEVLKPLRILKAVSTMSPGQDAVMEQTIWALAYFVSTLFLASGLVQALSMGRTEDWGDVDVAVAESKPMAFHDALYFIIVTFSTVGYGDIRPPDTTSRLVVVLLVGFFFFMIPRELNKLNHLLDLSSKYTGPYPKKLCGGHVIVGCDVASCGLVAAFLEEFFHEDHGYNATHAVLLVPSEPTMRWKRLVLKFAANDRVTYLKGDLRSITDLERVSTQTASCCFIICNRYGNLKEEEKRGFMRAINVQDFNPSIRIFVEALSVGMRQRLIKVGINPARIVCTSSINTRLLANACAWEGASTLVNNLLVSASIDEHRDMPSWLKEYAFGLGKEIYVVSIGAFSGRGFSELVLELFRQYGVVLLGISEDYRVVLHPGEGYIITKGDLGFLVADDADVAESIVEKAGALLPSRCRSSSRSITQRSAPGNGTAPGSSEDGRGSGRGGGRQGPAGWFGTQSSVRSVINWRSTTRPGSAAKEGVEPGADQEASGRNRVSDSAAIVSEAGAKGERCGGGGGVESSRPAEARRESDGVLGEDRRRVVPRQLPLSHTPCPMSPASSSDSGRGQSIRESRVSVSVSGRNGFDYREVSVADRRWETGANGVTDEDFSGGGHIVLVTPSLSEVSTLVEALEAPQVPSMLFVVVCPFYSWRREQDNEEKRRLRRIPQVRVVKGVASRAVLREAGANRARMVVLRSGRSFPEQESSDADAETIGQLVEVVAAAGPDVRVVVEVSDMTYGTQYEILVDRLRESSAMDRNASVSLTMPRARRGSALQIEEALPCPATQSGCGGDSGRARDSCSWRWFGTCLCKHQPIVEAGERSERGELGTRRRRNESGTKDLEAKGSCQGRQESPSAGPRNSAGGSGKPVDSSSSTTGDGAGGDRSGMHWSLSRGFASGAIVPNNLPESLLCQAYYNPAIIMIVEALLDPKSCTQGKHHDRGDDENDPSDEEGAMGSTRGSISIGLESEGGDSFLAQSVPPRRFFVEATNAGNRANFQELMSFMLREYDALPFGLLRHSKAAGTMQPGAEEIPMFVHCCPHPGQSVMPLDKVFLLAPSQESWERMQFESSLSRAPPHRDPGVIASNSRSSRDSLSSSSGPRRRRRAGEGRFATLSGPDQVLPANLTRSQSGDSLERPEREEAFWPRSAGARRRGFALPGEDRGRDRAWDRLSGEAGETQSGSSREGGRTDLDFVLSELKRVKSSLDSLIGRLERLEERNVVMSRSGR